jgi:hypothetical protein
MTTTTLHVRKDRLTEARLVEGEAAALAPGPGARARRRLRPHRQQRHLRRLRCGMHYWEFYPTHEEGWGIVPVWGFGTVVQSLHPGVAVGERLYGYWPMASSAILQPDRLGERELRRCGAAPAPRCTASYNRYLRSSRDPSTHRTPRTCRRCCARCTDVLADRRLPGRQRLLRGAHGAALQCFEQDGVGHGAAPAATRRHHHDRIHGPGQHGLLRKPGLLRTGVLPYADVATLDAATPCVYVDFAGDARFRAQVHERFKRCATAARWGARTSASSEARTACRDRALSCSSHRRRRRSGRTDWGAAAFGEKVLAGWRRLPGAA